MRTAPRTSPTFPGKTADRPVETEPAGGPGLPYRRLSRYWRDRFGTRVYRVPLDAGFTCPNRDGTRGTGGCRFCDAAGSAARPQQRGTPLRTQMERGMEYLRRRFGARKFLAYFQSFTNTYAPMEVLRRRYDAALDFPDVVGMSVGTRPDCVPDPVLELLGDYRDRGYVQLDLGLESIRDDSLRWMNRCHTVEEFRDAVRRSRRRGLEVCAHLIFGLPGEGRREAIGSAGEINRLGVEGVKIHMLHVLRDSPLEKTHATRPLPLLNREEYVSLVVDHLEHLHPDVVVHRLTGEAPPQRLIAPAWCADKNRVLAQIRAEMNRRQTWQGRCYRPPEGPAVRKPRVEAGVRPHGFFG